LVAFLIGRRRSTGKSENLPKKDPGGLVRPPGLLTDRLMAIESIVEYRNVLERRLVFDSQLHRKVGRILRHYSIT
jgi:hypothetical protein